MKKNSFPRALLNWYQLNGRKDLPWQLKRSAYRVWISEIMLQQTQVATVIPYFERFISRFPDISDLALANQDEVLHHWSGLGYYARARNLHKAAQQICDLYEGVFPEDFEQVLALPGIGRSTAGAILAQAAGQRHAILDGNVKRVLARYHGIEGWPGKASVQEQMWQYAEQHTPETRLADYTQAIMDLGATLCRRSKPDCKACPVSMECVAFNEGRVTELPTPKPRKTLPVKSARMLILLNNDNQVLLEKRPPTGIWGGLWSLPEMDLNADISSFCEQQWRFKVSDIQEGEIFRHTFSHYHFDILPCRLRVKNPEQSVMEDGGIVWYNTSQPDQRGLAAPVKSLLNRLSEE
ncbi:MAG: A/G-specific adenine glycosylase [Gammaproteobacteria bacterium]|nr:A/G-specific adenine glycosylase [Gammaproteobacteria bacterium]